MEKIEKEIAIHKDNLNQLTSKLTSNNNEISVKSGNYYGILKTKNGKLYLEQYEKYNTSQKIIYTSGLANIPGDILIGQVSNVSTIKDKNIITVEPCNNIFKNPYVSVIGG